MSVLEINYAKCKVQLKGIDISEKILHNIMLSGIHGIDKKSEELYKEQIKELGNYYISGIQKSFFDFISLCIESKNKENFYECTRSLSYIYALLKKSKKYIKDKMENKVLSDEIKKEMFNTSIEEQIGYSWKKSDLKKCNLYRENVELIQVAYKSFRDISSEKSIEEGILLNICTGEIYKTQGYKVYKPKSSLKEDMVLSILEVDRIYVFPGDKNPKVKIENFNYRRLRPLDLDNIKKHAKDDFSYVVKEAKSQIKDILKDKNPFYILKVFSIRKNKNNQLAIFDKNDNAILLKFESLRFLVESLKRVQLINQSLVCYFDYDIEENIFFGVPVAIINDENIISLFY